MRNELNSDITTLFCGQNVDANFTGLPPHGNMMFLIGDLGYHFIENYHLTFLDKKKQI
jgi:hypothetical protein